MSEVLEIQRLQVHGQNISGSEVRSRRIRDYSFLVRHSVVIFSKEYKTTKEYKKHKQIVIRKMDHVYAFCGVKKFSRKMSEMCCKSVKLRLAPLDVPPKENFHHMNGETPDSKYVLQNMRAYNSFFQTMSFGATSMNSEDDQFKP